MIKQIIITELKELPKNIRTLIKGSINYGVKNKIITNPNFRKLTHCVYTSQILAVCSKFNIRVVEGFVIDKNGDKHFHSWNEYGGYYFNLVCGYDNSVCFFGNIIPPNKLYKHILNNTSYYNTKYTPVSNTL